MSGTTRPFSYLALMLLAFYAYSFMARALYPILDLTAELDIYIFNKWLLMILLIVILAALGLRREAGLIPKANWSTLPLYWPMGVIVLLLFAGANDLPTAEVVVKTTIFCIAVGFTEEVMFRGLVFYWFKALSIRKIILISATSFAFIHFILGLSSEFPVEVIFGQAVFAFSGGLIFAAARARDVSVVIPILVHAVLDIMVVSAQGGISQTLDTEAQAPAGMLFIVAMLLAWGLWLLWKSGSPTRGSFAGESLAV